MYHKKSQRSKKTNIERKPRHRAIVASKNHNFDWIKRYSFFLSRPCKRKSVPKTPPFQSKSSAIGESKVGMRMLLSKRKKKQESSKQKVLYFWQSLSIPSHPWS
jgi:hypothetical protein